MNQIFTTKDRTDEKEAACFFSSNYKAILNKTIEDFEKAENSGNWQLFFHSADLLNHEQIIKEIETLLISTETLSLSRYNRSITNEGLELNYDISKWLININNNVLYSEEIKNRFSTLRLAVYGFSKVVKEISKYLKSESNPPDIIRDFFKGLSNPVDTIFSMFSENSLNKEASILDKNYLKAKSKMIINFSVLEKLILTEIHSILETKLTDSLSEINRSAKPNYESSDFDITFFQEDVFLTNNDSNLSGVNIAN